MPQKAMSIAAVRPAVSYPEIVGGVLKQLRTQRNLDQAALAKTVGIGQSAWSRIENGTTPITIEQLATATWELGMPAGQVLNYADEAVGRLMAQGVEVTAKRASPIGIENGRAFLKGTVILALLAAVLAGK